MSHRRRIILAVIAVPVLIVLVIGIQVAWWYTGFEKRLRLADEHAPIVLQALLADGRFSEVHAESFTASNGCLLVRAVIPAGTRSVFEAIVAATSPPVPVSYLVYEINSTTQPAH